MDEKDLEIQDLMHKATQYIKFAEWVANRIFSDDFEDDGFAEVACRKLEKLGLVVKTDEGNWQYIGDNCRAKMKD